MLKQHSQQHRSESDDKDTDSGEPELCLGIGLALLQHFSVDIVGYRRRAGEC